MACVERVTAKKVLLATGALLLVLSLLPAAAPGLALDGPGQTPMEEECTKRDGPVPEAVIERVRARYADETGFVDLLVAQEGHAWVLTALFDRDAREADLPQATSEEGVAVRVVGERFVPIGALSPSTRDPSTVPASCGTGIYPGVRISTPVGGCTANFVFTDQNGDYYIGSARHCFRSVGDRMSVPTLGPVGTVVYLTPGGPAVGRDFALVKIDPEDVSWVDHAMCHWGGPTAEQGTGRSVLHYGHGVPYRNFAETRPRMGDFASTGSSSFQFSGNVASGDSGSGSLRAQDGGALGVITHVNAGAVLFAHSAPYAYGTRITNAMSYVERDTNLELTLMTAPLE